MAERYEVHPNQIYLVAAVSGKKQRRIDRRHVVSSRRRHGQRAMRDRECSRYDGKTPSRLAPTHRETAAREAQRAVQHWRAVLNSDGNNQPRYVQLGLFLLANHGARVIAGGSDGNTVIVGAFS